MRYFAKITIDELRAKVREAMENHEDSDGEEAPDERYFGYYNSLTPAVEDDLSKVRFDTENMDAVPPEGTSLDNGYLGYHTLPNGMTFLGVQAGGDWEWPVYFIVYFDGKKLRGYIPTKGNTFNTDTMEAYGNAEEEDDNANKVKNGHVDEDGYGDSRYDFAEMVKDIESRIRPRPGEGIEAEPELDLGWLKDFPHLSRQIAVENWDKAEKIAADEIDKISAVKAREVVLTRALDLVKALRKKDR